MNRRIQVLAGALVVALAASVVAAPARAQDSGWFDPNQPAPAVDSASSPDPAGAPAAQEPGPLAPSPLLPAEAKSDPADQSPEALTKFRPYLDPYGTWVDDPKYGRVWVPAAGTVGPDFQPYVSNGRWALDDSGEWIWVSDYPFGWVVFHYGRWAWIPGSGWAWVPGLRYAPAWVVWRVPAGPDAYVGWAPMPPTFVWFGGAWVYYGYAPLYPYVFCPSAYLFSYNVHYYVVRDRYRMGYAARNTRPYVPASPRPRAGAHPVVAPRSPSLSTARVPAQGTPRERIASEYTRQPAQRLRSGVPLRSSDDYRESRQRTLQDGPTARPLDQRPRRAAPNLRDDNRALPQRHGSQRSVAPLSPSRSKPDLRSSPGTRHHQKR